MVRVILRCGAKRANWCIELKTISLGRLWINHGLAFLTTYGLSCSAGVITTTNQRIIREKRQTDTGAAVDLSVSYEDNIACKDILARYTA